MLEVRFLLYYLLAISALSATFFVLDKLKAQTQQGRLSENLLHALECFGGIFINIVLIYVIRHKNRKVRYYLISYLILLGWLAALWFSKDYLS